MPDNLRVKTFVNIRFMAIAKIATMVFSTIANVVLARNLSSSDYGIVGFAMIFISFLFLFKDLGLGSAVIQKKDLDDAGLYTASTINLILGFVLCLLAFFLAPVAGLFFHNDAVAVVVKVLSLNFLINSFLFIPNSLLTRELDYKKLFVSQIYSGIISSGLSIILALTGFKYWSIVIASLCSSLATVLIQNCLKPVRIRFSLDRRKAAELMRFGGNLFISALLTFMTFNLDNFTIGVVKGSVGLGYYALAFNWGSTICGLLANTVHTVLFPTFSKIQGDWLRLKSIYLRVLGYISFMSVVTNIVLLAVARDFLFYILGHGTDKWLPALPAFRIMCVYGIIRALLEPVGSVFLALGKANILLKANIVSAVLMMVFIYPVVVFFGLGGTAVIVTIAYVAQYLVYFPYLKKYYSLGYNEVWSVIRPGVISAGAVVVFIAAYSRIFQMDSIFFMFQKIFFGALVFFAVHELISGGTFIDETRTIIRDLKSRNKQLAAKAAPD